MKFYPHHIGDFDRATRHLTRTERSVYRDLIDLYYDTEAPLTPDKAVLCRRIIAHSDEESTAVEQVLNEFFTKTPTGWYHARCDAEIESYRANTSQKSLAGRASAEAKRLKRLQALNGSSTSVQQPLSSVDTDCNGTPTNHEPITNNQITPKAPKVAGGRFDEFWKAWPPTRRQDKKKCGEKWQRDKLDDLADSILADIAVKKKADKWTKDGGAYVEAPLVYLNGRRWEDETALPGPGEFTGDWRQSRSGIEAKGEELGLGRWDESGFQVGRGESFSAYRGRVISAADGAKPGAIPKNIAAAMAGLDFRGASQ